MGKASRKKRSDQKKQLKRAAKARRRALYASFAGTGRRAKKQRASGPTAHRGNHVMLDCGNVGCEQCYPQFRCLRQNEAPPKRQRIAVRVA